MEGLRSILKDPAERAAVKGAPREWPLFSAPGISSMRVVNVKEKGGTLVSRVKRIALLLEGIIMYTTSKFVSPKFQAVI